MYLGFLSLQLLLCAGLMYHAACSRTFAEPLLQKKAKLVSVLGLTDLCLFTEARYTRHPSMADLATPFQDYPFSLEHFPSGSLLPVPATLRK